MYVNPDIFEIDWDNLTGWTDGDTNGAVSDINPAGKLRLDITSASADAAAVRYKDLGSIGTDDYYVEIKISADTWDNQVADANDGGIKLEIGAGTNRINIFIGNNFTEGDGILLHDGASKVKVLSKTWNTEQDYVIVLHIHNSQTDMDIWVDKDPRTEVADVVDADCSLSGGTDGMIFVIGYGSVAGDGLYRSDYFYVGSELIPLPATPTTQASIIG